MEWTPDNQDQAPFWPGGVERRGPRWIPIVVAAAVVVIVATALIIWISNSGNEQDAVTDAVDESSEDDSAAEQPSDETETAPATDTEIDEPPASTSTTTTSTSTTTTTVGATTTTFVIEEPEDTEDFGTPTLSARSTVSTVGLDEVTFGMTLAKAQEAAGTALVPIGPTGTCYHVVPYDAPEGIVFLVSHGTIERVDINAAPITTRSGVGVGSPESMVLGLFGDSIVRQEREDGTVDLIFVPSDPGDQNFRVVFNIVDGEVRAYKSGRMPLIMGDTGCGDVPS